MDSGGRRTCRPRWRSSSVTCGRGGCLIVSGEHPVYGCFEWNGAQYAIVEPYFTEGPRKHESWKGVPIVIQRRTLGTFVGQIIEAGLQIEALVETPLNAATVKQAHADPARWYSAARASVMPTTVIIKARKPVPVRTGQHASR